jgi:hypothetical protein
MAFFGAILSVFFLVVMVYLLQHLSAIQYGYRIEQAKAELEALDAKADEGRPQQCERGGLRDSLLDAVISNHIQHLKVDGREPIHYA